MKENDDKLLKDYLILLNDLNMETLIHQMELLNSKLRKKLLIRKN